MVKPIMDAFIDSDQPVSIALLPDHPTPCIVRSHVHDPVPFVIYKPGESPDIVNRYDEESCREGSYGYIEDGDFIRLLLS